MENRLWLEPCGTHRLAPALQIEFEMGRPIALTRVGVGVSAPVRLRENRDNRTCSTA